MRLSIDIPHAELPIPNLSASLSLNADGKRAAIKIAGKAARGVKLGEFIGDGYFLASSGQLYDASRGPLRRLKSIVDFVDCETSEGLTEVCVSLQYLDFVITMLSDCQNLTVSLDEGLLEIVRRRKAAYDEPLDLSLFEGSLYPHQVDAVRWLKSRFSNGKGFALLADEQGLGKTVTACAFLASDVYSRDRASTTFIVCPASVIASWVDHLHRHLPSLRVAVISGSQSIRERMIRDHDFDIAVTSTGRMRRDAGAISKVHLDCLIIDEAASVKGHSSKNRSAARKLRADKRIGLSGTPMPNSVKELHGIIGCLSAQGYLGSLKSFNKRFTRPIEERGEKGAAEALRMLIEPCILRRLKSETLDLPEKTESEVFVDLPHDQREVYEAFRSSLKERLQRMSDEEFHANRIGVIGAFTNLRQIAVSPAAVIPDYAGSAVKIDMAVATTQKLLSEDAHKVVIHTLFVRDVVQRLSDGLSTRGISCLALIGDVPVDERASLIDLFESGKKAKVMIISSAGGEGINLQSADVEIQLTPFFHHGVTDQAADRLHRIGQTKNVRIYKLLANSTIESRMLELRNRKWDMSISVMKQDYRPTTKLTRSELLDILG